jgi:hypothetical protein
VRMVVLPTVMAFTVSSAAAQTQPEERVIPSDRVTTFVHIRSAPDADSTSLGRLEIGEGLPLVGTSPDGIRSAYRMARPGSSASRGPGFPMRSQRGRTMNSGFIS